MSTLLFRLLHPLCTRCGAFLTVAHKEGVLVSWCPNGRCGRTA